MRFRKMNKLITINLILILLCCVLLNTDYDIAHLNELFKVKTGQQDHGYSIEQISLPLIAAIPTETEPVHDHDTLHGAYLLRIKAGSSSRTKISLLGILVAVYVVLFLRFYCNFTKDRNQSIYYVCKRLIKYIHAQDGEKDGSAYKTCPIII